MSGISLTASMRSNLLSLQGTSKLIDLTQQRLSTGKKVNSAIDNPSNFYTAQSLNNRAKDLDALLDSMGQAVATIKAATTCLESSSSFLEQATAVATQALENAIPAKEYFMELVGENGAVVSTAQELKDAVNSGKETICVYGKIDYFVDETLTLHDGQKLVGTEYFTGYSGKEKFSRIYFENNVKIDNIKVGNNSIISDLYISRKSVEKQGTIVGVEYKNDVNIKNMDFYLFSDDTANSLCSAIRTFGSSVNISGNINLETGRSAQHDSGYAGFRLLTATNNSSARVDANINARIEGANSFLFQIGPQSRVTNDGSVLHIGSKTLLNFLGTDKSEIFTAIAIGTAIYIDDRATINSNLKELAEADTNIYTSPDANINLNKTFEEDDFILEKDDTLKEYDKQYANIISQYDAVINDGSYKGVNLLKNDNLNVSFNENGSSSIDVKGKDMDSKSLGFSISEWTNQGDIAQSLKEISSALQEIRNYNNELGNNYNIISGRQYFTESLINILTEGADKLTLADMNEESANMLSLQTRQQLAVNALSLASQASQSVLKLF